MNLAMTQPVQNLVGLFQREDLNRHQNKSHIFQKKIYYQKMPNHDSISDSFFDQQQAPLIPALSVYIHRRVYWTRRTASKDRFCTGTDMQFFVNAFEIGCESVSTLNSVWSAISLLE